MTLAKNLNLNRSRRCLMMQLLRFHRHIPLSYITKYVLLLLFVFVCITIFHLTVGSKLNEKSKNNFLPRPFKNSGNFSAAKKSTSFFDGPSKNIKHLKIDWHDYELIKYELQRKGLGEHGAKAVVGTNSKSKSMQKKIFRANGYNGFISDLISVNRSLPDIRHPGCKKKKYLAELPSVSVVVPFYNEHFSVLIRTAHSVLNRSPAHLLKEIILVNDCSTKKTLWQPLDDYVAKHFAGKVKVIHLKSRSGLIWARLAGARAATGDVLIFLDSHTEPLVNWLPPLLEPIAEDYRTCVCPLIDVIDFNTFEYNAQDEGQRGAFDWKFTYKRLPLPAEDLKHPTKPFKSPIMAGGLFAISSKFFWDLGGYDDGLDIWGGEQYELSFKIWQCGGQMLDAPCSRVGHIYRGSSPFENPRPGKDFVTRNFKRVAEVWMDEYKQYLYMRNPESYGKVDVGDLSKQRAIRDRLQCKPFKWFLDEVAYDLVAKFPFIDPPPFAKGAIQSVSNPKLCIDTLNAGEGEAIGLYPCGANLTHPYGNQMFMLSYFRDVVAANDQCLDVSIYTPTSKIRLEGCHQGQGNQFWRYDPATQMMMKDRNRNDCLDSNPAENTVFINRCNDTNLNQKWKWGFLNQTNIKNWYKYGAKFL